MSVTPVNFRRKTRVQLAVDLLRKWIADESAHLERHSRHCFHSFSAECSIHQELIGRISGMKAGLIAMGEDQKGETDEKPYTVLPK